MNSLFSSSAVASANWRLNAVRKAPQPYHNRKATPPQVTNASSNGERLNNALPPKIPPQINTTSLNAHSEATIR
ncbi:hypothetical protein D3C87_1899100 [compost metagenome]